MSNNYSSDKEAVCPALEKSKFNKKQMWHKRYKHCLENCTKCNELQILKKILWELRKT